MNKKSILTKRKYKNETCNYWEKRMSENEWRQSSGYTSQNQENQYIHGRILKREEGEKKMVKTS
jgi:hypothetical protein